MNTTYSSSHINCVTYNYGLLATISFPVNVCSYSRKHYYIVTNSLIFGIALFAHDFKVVLYLPRLSNVFFKYANGIVV
jgi:hypothetical protein